MGAPVIWNGTNAKFLTSTASTNNFINGYRPTATAAGTTTLVVGDANQQYFTGTTTQTVVLPVTSTLANVATNAQQYQIVNNSTGIVTVNSSGGNLIQAMAANTQLVVTCILNSGTTAASWSWIYSQLNGTGNLTSDLFSGNGSTTGFTLSVSPGSVNNTQVYISGVYQQKASYSLSGTTLTFGVAPPTGTNNIEVISGTTLSIGTPAAASVTGASFAAQNANTFLSGPTSGGSATPTFRGIVPADLGSQGAINVYTATGTSTFTTPSTSSTATKYYYKILAGGGGGGGVNSTNATGGGGGSGGYSEGTFTGVAASTGITITVGAGGTAGVNTGGAGGTGGTSSIGTPVSASCVGGTGGAGGGTIGNDGGAGGSASGGTFNLSGTKGQASTAGVGSASAVGGLGAASVLGGGGSGGSFGVRGAGEAGTYGAGGGGGVSGTAVGGAGGQGMVVIIQLTP